jgi:hypothetical protein
VEDDVLCGYRGVHIDGEDIENMMKWEVSVAWIHSTSSFRLY